MIVLDLLLIPPCLSVERLPMDKIGNGVAYEQTSDQQHHRCYCTKKVEPDANSSAFHEPEHENNKEGNPREPADSPLESLQPIWLEIEGSVRKDVHPFELDESAYEGEDGSRKEEKTPLFPR